MTNHREVTSAMDFFAVPTLTFRLLYCFFVVSHDRRRILHFNVTAHPTADWVCQQLREAFPDVSPYKYAILDRDTKFSSEVLDLLKASAIEPVRTSIRSPWQNGTAERWVGTARRECFDHVIAINEAHVRRLGREFVAYYHDDRTHLGLKKDTPAGRPVESKPDGGRLDSQSRIGGLHHRYVWKTAPKSPLKTESARALRSARGALVPTCDESSCANLSDSDQNPTAHPRSPRVIDPGGYHLTVKKWRPTEFWRGTALVPPSNACSCANLTGSQQKPQPNCPLKA